MYVRDNSVNMLALNAVVIASSESRKERHGQRDLTAVSQFTL